MALSARTFAKHERSLLKTAMDGGPERFLHLPSMSTQKQKPTPPSRLAFGCFEEVAP